MLRIRLRSQAEVRALRAYNLLRTTITTDERQPRPHTTSTNWAQKQENI